VSESIGSRQTAKHHHSHISNFTEERYTYVLLQFRESCSRTSGGQEGSCAFPIR